MISDQYINERFSLSQEDARVSQEKQEERENLEKEEEHGQKEN